MHISAVSGGPPKTSFGGVAGVGRVELGRYLFSAGIVLRDAKLLPRGDIERGGLRIGAR